MEEQESEEKGRVKRSLPKKIFYTFLVLIAVFLFISAIVGEFSFSLFIKSSVGTLVAAVLLEIIDRFFSRKKGDDEGQIPGI